MKRTGRILFILLLLIGIPSSVSLVTAQNTNRILANDLAVVRSMSSIPANADVTINDLSISPIDTNSLRIVSPPTMGSAQILNGQVVTAGDGSSVGVTTFMYEVCNQAGGCDTATVLMTFAPVTAQCEGFALLMVNGVPVNASDVPVGCQLDNTGGITPPIRPTRIPPTAIPPTPVPPTPIPPTPIPPTPVPPTVEPTLPPTEEPTLPPTEEPTQPPTEEPTEPPTEEPTQPPTEEPTEPPTEEPTEPPADSNFDTLVWSDEFNGTEIDPNNWRFQTGGGGWSHNESQYYTDRPENARVEDGFLIIEAREEQYEGHDYTSARMLTYERQEFQYGRIEARIQVPRGQGLWPAFWMIGTNAERVQWPWSGEIDIMEHIGGQPYQSVATLHGPGYLGGAAFQNVYNHNEPLANDFHVYSIEWSEDLIIWYFNDIEYHRVTADQVAEGTWVFNAPFFIFLNVAVGGWWPGYPDETTIFPQQMRVDWVRVWQ
ncbi:MAG: glycoside hydrolase family 16 protein [Chloroflexota bacterium]